MRGRDEIIRIGDLPEPAHVSSIQLSGYVLVRLGESGVFVDPNEKPDTLEKELMRYQIGFFYSNGSVPFYYNGRLFTRTHLNSGNHGGSMEKIAVSGAYSQDDIKERVETAIRDFRSNTRVNYRR